MQNGLNIDSIISAWSISSGAKKTQRNLADAIGCTQSTLQNWKSGRTSPRICDLTKIQQATGLTIKMMIE